jgi:hypothetical protein
MLDGLRFAWRDPYLRAMTAFSSLANLALTGVDALIVVFLVRTVGLSSASAGLVVASFGVGGVLGALVARPMGRRFGTARAILAADAGGLSCALLLPLTSTGPRLAWASAAMICVACGVVIGNVIVVSFMAAVEETDPQPQRSTLFADEDATRCRPQLGSAFLVRRGRAAFGLVRRLQTSYERDLSPVAGGQGPWCESDGGGVCRQMEVTTIGDMMETFAAILIGISAFAAVILGFIIVVAAGWFIQASR